MERERETKQNLMKQTQIKTFDFGYLLWVAILIVARQCMKNSFTEFQNVANII